MGWLIALAVLVLLASLPLGVSVKYDSGGPLVRLLAGPGKLTLYPRPKKKPKPEKKAPEKPAKPEKPKQEEPKPPQPPKEEAPKPKEKGGRALDFLPLVKTALDLLGDFRRKLRVKNLELKLILAGNDPCDLAVNYGRANVAMGNLLPQLERLFVIKKRDIQVECDFTASETLVIARLDVTITLGRLLSLGVWYGLRALKEFLTIKKKRKGGAVT